MSRRSFDGTPPAGAGAFFDGPPLPRAFRESDGMQSTPKRPAPNTRQLLIVAALTLVALALTWPGTPRSPGSGLVLGPGGLVVDEGVQGVGCRMVGEADSAGVGAFGKTVEL